MPDVRGLPPEPTVTSDGRRRAGAALAVAALAAALNAPRLDRPWDRSIASASATYQMLFVRNWDEAGFAALRGIPCVGIGGETAVERDPYLHHPVLTYWIEYAIRRWLGWTERAFRLLPFLATVLSAGLTVLLAARLAGLRGGALAGLLFLCLPLGSAFGLMANPEATVLLALVAGFLAWLRLRERPTPARQWVLFAVFFAGCQADWGAYFLAPALLLGEFLRPPGARRWREPLLLFPVGAAAFLATVLHFAWGVGDARLALEHVFGTALTTVSGAAGRTLPAFLANQADVVREYVGWPPLALLAGLALAAVARPGRLRREPGAVLAALAVPVMLNLSIFQAPAFDHAFYWMPGMLFFPAAAAVALRGTEARSPVLALLATAALFGGSVWVSARQEAGRVASEKDIAAAAVLVDRFAAGGDLVLTPEPVGPAAFYTRARVYEDVHTIKAVTDALERGRWYRRLHVFISAEKVPAHQELVWWLDRRGRANDHPPHFRGWTLEPGRN